MPAVGKFGLCCCNCPPCPDHRDSEAAIATSTNITLVPDWRDPGDPEYSAGGISPWMRRDNGATWPFGDGCLVPPTCASGEEPCGPWPLDERVTQTFSAGGTVDHSVCVKRGFKPAQGYKFWHGHLPMNTHDLGSNYDGIQFYNGGDPELEPFTWSLYCFTESEQTTSSSTKYLTMEFTGTMLYLWTDPEGILPDEWRTQTAALSFSIDRYSGVMTRNSATWPTDQTVSYHDSLQVLRTGKVFPHTFLEFANMDERAGTVGFTGLATGEYPDDVNEYVDGEFSWTRKYGPDTVPELEGELREESGFDGTKWFRKVYGAIGGGGSAVNRLQGEWYLTVTDTTMHWEQKEYSYDPDGSNQTLISHIDVTTTLSDPYTGAQCWGDVKDLLANIDLTDDLKYKWRGDGWTTIAPLMTRNEVPSNTPPVFVEPELDVDDSVLPWTDPNAGTYDGAVKGGLLELGQDRWFDWDHVTWNLCSPSGSPLWFKQFYGSWSGDVLPPCKQWTSNYDTVVTAAGDLPRSGAWIIHQPGGAIHAGKLAVTLIERPKYNVQRPCGDDKYRLDETTVRCVTDLTGSVVTILSETAIDTGDLCYAGGGSISAGFYTVTKLTDTTYELTTPVFYGTSPLDYNEGTGILGKVRWPDVGACTGDTTSEGKFVYAVWGFNYRDIGERNRKIAEAANCEFYGETLPDPGSPLRTNQALHGMPSEVSDFTATQLQVPITCGYRVACITPNGETFARGTTQAMPDFVPDERYGARWQADIIQHMVDPLWQTPHVSCVDCSGTIMETNCAATEDDGGCAEDTCLTGCDGTDYIEYYPQRPWVEAWTSLPAGAPALPAGIYIGYLTLADLDTSGSVVGNVLPPPTGPGWTGSAVNAVLTPWVIAINQVACVCGAGRFETEYRANGINPDCAGEGF